MIRSLTKECSIKFYYEFYSLIYNFENNHHLFCFCQDIPGCPDELGRRNYCLICQFFWTYSLEDLEKVKKDPIHIVKLYIKMKNELEVIKEYDNLSEEIWCKDVVFSGRCRDWGFYLSDFIEYLFLA